MTLTQKQFKEDFNKALLDIFSMTIEQSTNYEQYAALTSVIKSYYAELWQENKEYEIKHKNKQAYYFSIEFLPGKMLKSNLLNLGILDLVRDSLADCKLSLDEIAQKEPDMALGNGGLGRLASCFMDSLASTGLPGNGNGIRYKYGLFKQKIVNGHQVELPDTWLNDGNPWEIRKANKAVEVKFGGSVWLEEDKNGHLTPHYKEQQVVLAVPYDIPQVGYQNRTVNNLRLWRAEVPSDISYQYQNLDFMRTVDSLTSVLYPDDSNYDGQLLRLKQEYFFVSAGLKSIVNYHVKSNQSINNLSEQIAVHINDTHPALCVAELMRILLDDYLLPWDNAWDITVKVMSYTNHTIMAEALEKWSIEMFNALLPRIYQIIQEIDRRFVEEMLVKFDSDRVQRTRIIQAGNVHMAHLAIIGSHSINGVAELHSNLLKEIVLHDFYVIYPERFNNKTNGIAQRRWLQIANEGLSELIDNAIGQSWRKNLDDLTSLMAFASDEQTLEQLMTIKLANKKRLADLILKENGVEVNPNAIFDVQIKRLHAYKRQLLNLLHILKLYFDLKNDPSLEIVPRVFIFGAKAAPSYQYAKAIIKVINEVANLINNDQSINNQLKVIFIENYNVSLAEIIIPAADVSEQISLASKEASGTSNMKLMLNGAVTIATLDGANIEIKEAVGDDNIFIFGLTTDEVYQYFKNNNYNSREIYENNPSINRILNSFIDGTIPNIVNEGREIFDSLTTYNDEYFVLRDFDDYIKTQKQLELRFLDRQEWAKTSLINIANAGRFSSDRTVKQYAEEIWQIEARR